MVLIILTALSGVIMILFSFSSAAQLYADIGALPWHDPEIKGSLTGSERHSQNDINAAWKAAIRTYKDEWHTYNGIYMLELNYIKQFDDEKQDENDGDWIYFTSVMYTGYGSDVAEENKGKRHDVYWAAEKQPDGSWLCHGCAEIAEADKSR